MKGVIFMKYLTKTQQNYILAETEKNPVLDHCVANLIRETKEVYYDKGVEDILKACESEFKRGRRKGQLYGIILTTLALCCGYVYGTFSECKKSENKIES